MGSRRGQEKGPSWRGRIKGVEGWRGYFTALEGLVGVGEQCGKVTLPHLLFFPSNSAPFFQSGNTSKLSTVSSYNLHAL